MNPYRLTLLLGLALGVLALPACSKKAKLEDHLKVADEAFQARQFEKAKIEYLNVLRLQRTNMLAYARLGKIFWEQDQPSDAYNLLQLGRTAFPDDLEIREKIVMILSRAAGQTNRFLMLAEADGLLERSPTNEIGVLVLADSSRSEEEVADFEARLQALRAKAGDHLVFQIGEAEILRRRGDTNACEAILQRALAAHPTSTLALLSYGNFLVLQGRIPEAETPLRTAKELSPPHHPSWERWAIYLTNLGRDEEAKAVLDEILARAPERLFAYRSRAEYAMREGKLDDAERILGRALAIAPKHTKSHQMMGTIRLMRNQPAEAVREMEKAVQSLPQSSDAHYQLAISQLLNKQVEDAVRSLQRAVAANSNSIPSILLLADLNIALGRAEQTTASLRSLVARLPNLAPAHDRLIRAERAAGRLAEAETAARTAAQRFPKDAGLAFQLGLVLRQQRKYTEARQAFETASTLTTNTYPVVEQLVGLDIAEGRIPAALERLDRRIEQLPSDALAWHLKAEVLLRQGDAARAETAIRKAIELDPKSESAVLALAKIQSSAGNAAGAVQELQGVLQRNPDDVRALLMLGLLESNRGEYARAAEAYERFLRTNPRSTVALNNLAAIYTDHIERLDDALRHAQRARELDADDPVIADTLGWVHYRRGQYAEALRLLTEAATKFAAAGTDIPEVSYHLGMAHYMMGNEEPARAALRQAVESKDDFRAKPVAREFLAMLDAAPGQANAQSIALLEKRRAENPKDLLSLVRLGHAYAATGQPAKALDAFQGGLALNPDSATILIQVAKLYANELQDTAKALEAARKARSLAPRDPEVAYTFGRIAFNAGDQTLAYSLLQESARALGTNRTDVLFDFGVAAYSQSRVEDAIQAMNRVAANPNPHPAIARAAQTYLQLLAITRNAGSPPADAATLVQETLRTDPSHGPALEVSARLAERDGRYADARKAYETLLARYPAYTPAMRNLAILCADHLNDDTTAYQMGMKARDADQRDDILGAALGKVATRRGDHRFAAQLLTQASRTQANDASLFYHLGLAQLGLKQPADARTAFNKALALAPNAPFAADISKRLQEIQ